ncbi:amidohydrolase family protein [Nocardioides sp.]|uniref:amidohydrolase n=1 Tax=Nocardioides sp. TaxID=35761 RepID=UPI001A28E144|nr:amidohydrolase family protein [Nocardioides sp.]MBJ7358547.1 amidohydrolase family protein [Nocardioides sp.]
MPDLLLRNARLVPVGNAATYDGVLDVLVEDGTVTQVAPRVERPQRVEEVDAEGRWVAPGLWDQHVHFTQWVEGRQRLDLAGATSVEEATAIVAARLAAAPGQPVVGWGHRSAFMGRDGTTAELDAVSTEVPVLLVSGDGHHAWANTLAYNLLGLPVRDDVVRENEWFDAYPRIGVLTGGQTDPPQAYREALAAAAALGVVGFVDFEFNGRVQPWVDRWHDGGDLLRVRWATYAAGLDEVLESGLRTGDPVPGADGRLTMGPLKIISDGSLNTRTAWCCDLYADADVLEHPAGLPNQSGAELRSLLGRATQGGLEVATHAIGDAAVTEALSAYAETWATGSIEHAQLVQRHDVHRIAELGLRASVQPAHLLDDRDLTEKIWPGRGERCFAFRWMLDEGVELSLGSDAPVSPLDPWLAIASAVHRSGDDRDPWHAEQSLTPAEALAASVDGQPTVAVGSRGDLVLLDRDPLAVGETTQQTAAALRGMPVALTVVAGRVVHRAD